MHLTPWDFFVMEQIEKEQNIETVARHLANNYSGIVDYEIFCEACRECGVDPTGFQQDDIEAIERALNRM